MQGERGDTRGHDPTLQDQEGSQQSGQQNFLL